ncbi:MAG: glycosyltransferase family 4 protein [Bacteroidetes bacterium]|nr:glycosyltransferase family 4 protein [Bacteroidota bacterium]
MKKWRSYQIQHGAYIIFRKSLIADLQHAGYQVFCIASDQFTIKIQLELGWRIYSIHQLEAKGSNLLEDLSLIVEFRKLFMKYKFDIVLSYTAKPNIYGNLGALFSPTKFINTVNGLGSGLASDGWVSKIMRRLYKVAFRKSSAVIFQNQDDRDYFILHHIVDQSKTYLVNGSGIDLQEFEQKKNFNEDSSTMKFLLSARLVKEKGILEYIAAATELKKQFPNVKFYLCGLIANNPSAIPANDLDAYHQKGIIDYIKGSDDMNALLHEMDVLVLPSYYREGVPRILLEGLSKGLPILTTNSVGCKETVEEGINGYKIPVRDIASLQNAMRQFIDMPFANRMAMGEASRKLAAEKFSVEKVNQQYLRLIQELT